MFCCFVLSLLMFWCFVVLLFCPNVDLLFCCFVVLLFWCFIACFVSLLVCWFVNLLICCFNSFFVLTVLEIVDIALMDNDGGGLAGVVEPAAGALVLPL